MFVVICYSDNRKRIEVLSQAWVPGYFDKVVNIKVWNSGTPTSESGVGIQLLCHQPMFLSEIRKIPSSMTATNSGQLFLV